MKTMLVAAVLFSAIGVVASHADQAHSRTYAMTAAPKTAVSSEPVLPDKSGQMNEQPQLTWDDLKIGNPRMIGVLPNGVLATYN